MFLNEMSLAEQELFLKWVRDNKIMILCDILKGRGEFAAEWFLVIQKIKNEPLRWVLKPINEVLNFFDGDVLISKKGNLHLGKVTIQRKGGDNGRKSANYL